MIETDVLVLGGGPTGLGAATRLQDHKADWLLLEGADEVGGLSSSFVDENGFTWDLGGHVQFSHYETFDRYMDLALGEDGWFEHQRESWVWIRGRWVPYPFQNNLHRLDPQDRWAAVKGLMDASEAEREGYEGKPENFEAWIHRTFGPGVADLFMMPYNYKVWAYPPKTMAYNWIGERVAVPKLEGVMKGVCTGEDAVSWGPNATFRFPKFGGTGAVWKSIGRMLDPARVKTKTKVVAIDVENKVVSTDAGEEIRYKRLISSLALNHLIRLAPGVVDEAEAEKLVYSTTHVVGVGLEGQPPADLETKCWMYFPESNSPYYRVTVFSNYSENNVPKPGEQWSLMTETAQSPAKPVNVDTLVDDTVNALIEDKLIPEPGKIISKTHRSLKQGYPTPFLGRDDVVDPALRAFEKFDVYSRGRFGAWKYEISNQDHSFAQGYECVERLLGNGSPEHEPTLFSPSVVNNRRNP